jgi:protein-S-isoprenylcysteine O-methyltransferase Ste14
MTFFRTGRNGLELKLPPLALVALLVAAMWGVATAAPDFDITLPARLIGSFGLALLGVAICVSGIASFRRAGTTVNPMSPDSSSSLVISGIYRYTRNPMYLGMLLILLGWAVFLSNLVALLFLPAFVLYMNRYQIGPEERALTALFANEFSKYCATVRRWV